jgi:hypothetical protein
LNWRTVEPCSSTRWPRSTRCCRRNWYARLRTGRSNVSVRVWGSRSTSARSRRPAARSTRLSRTTGFARISTTTSAPSRCGSRRSASGRATSRFSRSVSSPGSARPRALRRTARCSPRGPWPRCRATGGPATSASWATVSRAALSARDRVVDTEDLQFLRAPGPNGAATSGHAVVPLCDIERAHIQKALDTVSWNKKMAARLLKISRETLYRKIRTFHLAPAAGPGSTTERPRT